MTMSNKDYALLFVISFVAFFSILNILSPVTTFPGGTPVIGGAGSTSGTDSSSRCSGSVQLSFFPESVDYGGRASAIMSGLENCNDKVVFVKQQIDADQDLKCSCVVATGNGCGCAFAIDSEQACSFSTYYAYVDMNANGDYNDQGETSTAALPVTSCPIV